MKNFRQLPNSVQSAIITTTIMAIVVIVFGITHLAFMFLQWVWGSSPSLAMGLGIWWIIFMVIYFND